MTWRNRNWRLTLVIAVIASTQVAAETYSGDGSLKGNVTIEINLVPEEGADSVSVAIETRVKRGVVTWLLTDPEGETVFDGRAVKGSLSLESGELDATAGVWRLTMEAEGVKMRYKIDTLGLVEVEKVANSTR